VWNLPGEERSNLHLAGPGHQRAGRNKNLDRCASTARGRGGEPLPQENKIMADLSEKDRGERKRHCWGQERGCKKIVRLYKGRKIKKQRRGGRSLGQAKWVNGELRRRRSEPTTVQGAPSGESIASMEGHQKDP